MGWGGKLVLPLPVLAILGTVLALPLLGVSGPDQAFTMEPGESLDSYLRISNDGDRRLEVTLSIRGEVSGMIQAQGTIFSLDPGTSRRVALHYRVPASATVGTYAGEILLGPGEGVHTALSRQVAVTVAESVERRLALRKGLNLVGWPGPESSLEEAFRGHPQVAKVWRRNDAGDYEVATYYPEHGAWWSPDAVLNRLQTGEAYFLECASDALLPVEAIGSPRSIELAPGMNLLGWTGPETPVPEAFPQSPENHPIDRVWRRNRDGSYSSIDYFPSYDTWWGADPDFTVLEWGRAYFVEASGPTVVSVPGVK